MSFKDRHDSIEARAERELAKAIWSAEKISLALTPKPARKASPRRRRDPALDRPRAV